MSLSLNDKILVAKKLDAFGIHYIEGGWPGSNPKDAGFFREIKKAGLRNAVVCAFGSTRRAKGKAKEDHQLKTAWREALLQVTSVRAADQRDARRTGPLPGRGLRR